MDFNLKKLCGRPGCAYVVCFAKFANITLVLTIQVCWDWTQQPLVNNSRLFRGSCCLLVKV